MRFKYWESLYITSLDRVFRRLPLGCTEIKLAELSRSADVFAYSRQVGGGATSGETEVVTI